MVTERVPTGRKYDVFNGVMKKILATQIHMSNYTFSSHLAHCAQEKKIIKKGN